MNIEEISYVHMFPETLKEMDKSEMSCDAWSVPQGNRHGRTVPLFTLEQVREIIKHAFEQE